MTEAQQRQIRNLRAEGFGYKRIAEQLSVSENTIKTYCRRNGLGGNQANARGTSKHVCLYCGVEVKQNAGRKEKKFCSDKCRNKWWNANLDRVNRKAVYEYVCSCCKKPFTAYGNAHRKYCSHQCYIKDRFGGGKR